MFSLSKSGKDGISEREHLEQVEKQTGIRPEGLESPDFPMVISHVWSAFIALSKTRSMGFSGPNPITYEQILAWKKLTSTPLDAREVETVMSLDTIYMRVING
jgi:hypothetical protein